MILTVAVFQSGTINKAADTQNTKNILFTADRIIGPKLNILLSFITSNQIK